MKYAAFYAGKRIEVEAESSLKAQVAAANLFKAKRRYNVVVALLEKDGKPVVHSVAAFCG
jgi:hypothetical protein